MKFYLDGKEIGVIKSLSMHFRLTIDSPEQVQHWLDGVTLLDFDRDRMIREEWTETDGGAE